MAACVWDHAGGQGPLAAFWDAAHELDPHVEDESRLAGAREGHLEELFQAAGLQDVEETALAVRVEHPTFEDWWEPFTLGVGPAGGYAAGLDPERQARLRERCRELLPTAPFVLTSRAWAARGVVEAAGGSATRMYREDIGSHVESGALVEDPVSREQRRRACSCVSVALRSTRARPLRS